MNPNVKMIERTGERDCLITSIEHRAAALGLDMPPPAPIAINPVTFDERSTGIAVVSLQGLRRLDAALQELGDHRLALAEATDGEDGAAPYPDDAEAGA